MESVKKWKSLVEPFLNQGETGKDPIAAVFKERRKSWSLFTPLMGDDEIEALRDYIMPYQSKGLPEKDSDQPVKVCNFINGQWKDASGGKRATMNTLWDKRVPLCDLPDSDEKDVNEAVAAAKEYWQSLDWADEGGAYRKWVMQNFSRMLNYFQRELKDQIRHCIPKTEAEANKDFWEAKRCVDHISGNYEKAMLGEEIPPMVPGMNFWKNQQVPAGVSAVITPMNFIYGIPVIQLVGVYMSGSPFIYKGHPFGGICNTSIVRMMLAAGADPRVIQKIEGFGGRIGSLATHQDVDLVSITGSEFTAKAIAKDRNVRPLKFEGGGCNWAWLDDDLSDDELKRAADRLTYSWLCFSTHKCTSLHGVAASSKVLSKLTKMMNEAANEWMIQNPKDTPETADKVVGPCMVHKAQTASNIQEAAEKAGLKITRRGGRKSGDDYSDNAEVIEPIMIEGVTPKGPMLTCDWDGKGERTFNPATTEFFMPILTVMEVETFDDFIKFCLFENTHDLSTALWTKNPAVLARARGTLGGMLKINDGTDAALDWEEFGASGMGDSGNMGVGDAESTVKIFTRKQKGRQLQL